MPRQTSTSYPESFGSIFLRRLVRPVCSRLYSPEPIGIGTPMVESLTSYIVRLASAHCVHVGTLVAKEIAPLINKNYLTARLSGTMSSQFSSMSMTANSFGITAIDWVDTLQKLTLRQDFRFLTLLPLRGVLTANRLQRKVRAWCSSCYEDWHHHGKPVYDPLVWSISAVTACSIHKQVLKQRCDRCNKVSPPLAWNSLSGFCRHCNSWLGITRPSVSAEDNLLTDIELKWQEWVIDHLGAVLAELSQGGPPLKTEAVKHLVFTCVQRTTRGDLKAFVRRFNSFTYRTMCKWMRGESLPQLIRLMDLCYRTEVSMKDALFGREHVDDTSPKFTPIRPRESFYITTVDVMRMEVALHLMLDEYPPPSQIETAKRIGCHVLTIKKHLPQLFSLIRERYLTFEAKRFDEQRIKSALANAKKEHPPPSLDSIVKKLGCSSSFLRTKFPNDCHIISARHYEYRKVFVDLEAARAKLQALQSAFPPLSIAQCAEQLGCTRESLSRIFPEICRPIGARYRNHYRERSRQRIEQRKAAIIEAYTALETEGINPTLYRIKNRLSQLDGLTNLEIERALQSLPSTSNLTKEQ